MIWCSNPSPSHKATFCASDNKDIAILKLSNHLASIINMNMKEVNYSPWFSVDNKCEKLQVPCLTKCIFTGAPCLEAIISAEILLGLSILSPLWFLNRKIWTELWKSEHPHHRLRKCKSIRQYTFHYLLSWTEQANMHSAENN